MKTLIVLTAAALTFGTAAFADSTAQFAAEHFAQSHDGDGPRKVPTLTNGDEIVSTKGDSLAAFAAKKLANGPEDKR